MKIVYAGTPQFAVRPLEKILDAGFDVAGVLAQPDRPQGRKGLLVPPPVKALALKRGIPVFQPAKLKEETAGLAALGGDVMITCAYGQILTRRRWPSFPWACGTSTLPCCPAIGALRPFRPRSRRARRRRG